MSTALHKLMDAVDADSFEPAAVYELDLPKERQSVLDDRSIRGEVSSPEEKKQVAAEIAAYRKAIGLK
jgi:hypothetical protein